MVLDRRRTAAGVTQGLVVPVAGAAGVEAGAGLVGAAGAGEAAAGAGCVASPAGAGKPAPVCNVESAAGVAGVAAGTVEGTAISRAGSGVEGWLDSIPAGAVAAGASLAAGGE